MLVEGTLMGPHGLALGEQVGTDGWGRAQGPESAKAQK